MTTIVIDGRTKGKTIICADNQNTEPGWLAPCQKIYEIAEGPNEGDVICTVGAGAPGLLLIERWKAGNKPSMLEFDDAAQLTLDTDEEFECALVSDGKFYMIGRLFMQIPVDLPYFAVGSGGAWALGALEVGATARQAVEVACKYDACTGKVGRPLQYLDIQR